MQLLDVVFQAARQVSLDRIVNVGYIRNHWTDTGSFYALL
jgi:hypothetical protein